MVATGRIAINLQAKLKSVALNYFRKGQMLQINIFKQFYYFIKKPFAHLRESHLLYWMQKLSKINPLVLGDH